MARRAWTVALTGVGAAVVVAGLVRVGNPLEVVDAFTAPLPAATGRRLPASRFGHADPAAAADHDVVEDTDAYEVTHLP